MFGRERLLAMRVDDLQELALRQLHRSSFVGRNHNERASGLAYRSLRRSNGRQTAEARGDAVLRAHRRGTAGSGGGCGQHD